MNLWSLIYSLICYLNVCQFHQKLPTCLDVASICVCSLISNSFWFFAYHQMISGLSLFKEQNLLLILWLLWTLFILSFSDFQLLPSQNKESYRQRANSWYTGGKCSFCSHLLNCGSWELPRDPISSPENSGAPPIYLKNVFLLEAVSQRGDRASLYPWLHFAWAVREIPTKQNKTMQSRSCHVNFDWYYCKTCSVTTVENLDNSEKFGEFVCIVKYIANCSHSHL